MGLLFDNDFRLSHGIYSEEGDAGMPRYRYEDVADSVEVTIHIRVVPDPLV